MASSSTAPSPEPQKIQRILFFGSDLLALARILPRFHGAELVHIHDRDAVEADSFKDIDFVVCSPDCFRSALKPPAREPDHTPRPTARRREIAQLVSKGLSNGEIAHVIGMSERAVRGEVSALLMLFEASNRTELASLITEGEAA